MTPNPPQMPADLRTGDTFAVRLPGGRYGACRVLRATTDGGRHNALVASLAWLGDVPPSPTEPRLRLLQRITRPGWPGEPNLFWVRGKALPDTLTYLGVLESSPGESALGFGVGHRDWEEFTDLIAAQWRYEEEQGLPPAAGEPELRARAREAGRRHAVRRREEALANLSGDPFPPNEDGDEEEDAPRYRDILRDCLATLRGLGPDGDEVARLDALRHCVERFNVLEEHIDTYLREVICERFDDLVWVAGLEDYGEDLNCPWRDF